MKRMICLALLFTTLPHASVSAQNPSADDRIRVILPAAVDVNGCQLRDYRVGAFGGHGGSARPVRHAPQFAIELSHEGVAVERLKAYVYCSGYQVQTMTFDSLPPPSLRIVQLQPEPLPTLRFVGQVRGLSLRNEQSVTVEIDFWPSWECQFFGLNDCLLGRWKITSVSVGADGAFSVALPDFARDAVIGSHERAGWFTFGIREKDSGNVLFRLQPATARAGGGLPVADDYPGVHIFDVQSVMR